MAFTQERRERLEALMAVLNQERNRVDYRLSPLLREAEALVSAQLAEEAAPEADTLREALAVCRCVGRLYDRMARFPLSARAYRRALELSVILKQRGEEVTGVQMLLENALYARNYYVDDDCADLKELASALLDADTVTEIDSRKALRYRRLKHDPVEMTEEYLAVIDEVEELVEKNREYSGFGSCHHLWSLKTQYLAQRGIRWRSPAVMNPRVLFD